MTLVISKGITLDNGTRAAAIAGVSPTLDYRFAREKREIETVSLTDKLTYTGGNGTFTGSDGFIQPATTNVPRFDHDPLSRQSLGLLSEVARANVLLRSEEYGNASWTKFNAASALDRVGISPSGAFSASTISKTTAANGLIFQTAGAAGVYTCSWFLKADTAELATIGCTLSFEGRHCTFDLVNGTVVEVGNYNGAIGTITGGDALITAYPSGWYRCALVGVTITQARAFHVGPGSINNTVAQSILAWGAQLEAASTPSTYIPTTSAAITRTADSAVIDGTGVLTGIYTMVEKPAGCAVVSGSNINLQPGFTAERVMVFPAALDAGQITAIRGAM